MMKLTAELLICVFLLMSAFPVCVYHALTVGILEDTGR